MIAELLPHLQLQDPEAVRPLAGLGDTLRDAHELVVSCQGRSVAYQFVMAGKQADRFRDVQSRIDSYLILFPVISYIGITRRLDRIYNILVPDSATSSPSPLLQSTQPQESEARVAEEVPRLVGTEEFTLAELVAATNNFACDTMVGSGGTGVVYRGRLHDWREVAVKRYFKQRYSQQEFDMELAILSPLRHKHIIRLLGWCAVDKEYKRLLSFRRKEQEKERLLIFEYMENGTLSDHLHGQPSSPVWTSWKTRVEVLLGAARGIEHLHCHAGPPVIHRDIKPSNILLDAHWVAHLSDFGISVPWDPREADPVHNVMGTLGYVAPEHLMEGRLSPASDVYSFGRVMLVTLTGMRPHRTNPNEGPPMRGVRSIADCVSAIEAGNLRKVLDRRPALEWRHLKALDLVASMAMRCQRLSSRDRPPISVVVANLEAALELICSDQA